MGLPSPWFRLSSGGSVRSAWLTALRQLDREDTANSVCAGFGSLRKRERAGEENARENGPENEKALPLI